MGVTGLRGDWTEHLQLAVALQQSALSAVMKLGDSERGEVLSQRGDWVPGADRSRVFEGRPDQVRVARAFVREGLCGHQARDEAVLVASELVTNAVAHSASGHPGGMFVVHLSELSACHVALIVTDLGGPAVPRQRRASADAESGRGLSVVKSMTSMLEFFSDGQLRSVLAVIPAPAHADGSL